MDLVACSSSAFLSWSGLAGASAILRLYAILCGREVGKEGSRVSPCQDDLGWNHSHFELEVAGDPGSRARFRTERLRRSMNNGWIPWFVILTISDIKGHIMIYQSKASPFYIGSLLYISGDANNISLHTFHNLNQSWQPQRTRPWRFLTGTSRWTLEIAAWQGGTAEHNMKEWNSSGWSEKYGLDINRKYVHTRWYRFKQRVFQWEVPLSSSPSEVYLFLLAFGTKSSLWTPQPWGRSCATNDWNKSCEVRFLMTHTHTHALAHSLSTAATKAISAMFELKQADGNCWFDASVGDITHANFYSQHLHFLGQVESPS